MSPVVVAVVAFALFVLALCCIPFATWPLVVATFVLIAASLFCCLWLLVRIYA